MRFVRGAHVALVFAGISRPKFKVIIDLFQEDPETLRKYSNIHPPQYIVGTTKLIGVGLTLHKARYVVQMEPEWMKRDELQAAGRVNRVGQLRDTFTYLIFNQSSRVERIVARRSTRRTELLKLALDPNIVDNTAGLQRGIGEYAESEAEEAGQEEGADAVA